MNFNGGLLDLKGKNLYLKDHNAEKPSMDPKNGRKF